MRGARGNSRSYRDIPNSPQRPVRLDLGEQTYGIQTIVPARTGKPYPVFVPQLDDDGNETAGIRMPELAVPLGTHTGWNVYQAVPSELCDRDGSYVPFAKTKAEREAAGDPRLSLEERYGSRAVYVAKIKAAADALVGERLLLPADAAAYVKAAEASDRF